MDQENFTDAPFDLIISALDGSISKTDQIKVNAWRSLSSENEATYQRISLLSADIEILAAYQQLNPETSWYSLRQRLEGATADESLPHSQPSEIKRMNVRQLARLISVAASLVLITWVSVRFSHSEENVRISTAASEQRNMVLPDGSEILMNGHTEIFFDRKNFKKNRVVRLSTGEAFFKVIHNNNFPFTINVSNLVIKDIGTSFNVRKTEKQVCVIVNSGSVSVLAKKSHHPVLLTANQKAISNSNSSEIISGTNNDINYKAWADHNFRFISTDLKEVIESLQNVYGTQILLADSGLAKKKLTVSFHSQNIDNVLNIIGKTMELRIEKKGGIFYVKNGTF